MLPPLIVINITPQVSPEPHIASTKKDPTSFFMLLPRTNGVSSAYVNKPMIQSFIPRLRRPNLP
ncbi:hypothetical protein [Geothrix fuzhouensis]|uniref:hypothetical protein n=1 Tax=Geothrix fuzhouensis TaxID=2966451 RepID=UPI002148E6E4|nr:hypothetical protein [Geothrix fuzhouensis]